MRVEDFQLEGLAEGVEDGVHFQKRIRVVLEARLDELMNVVDLRMGAKKGHRSIKVK